MLIACVVAGLTLPDVDQPLPLDHRSGLTHSILPALAAMAWRWARPVAAGLALGIALHLSADVFPNAMVGYATVKLPFAGSIGGDASYAWLALNAIGCAALGGWLLRGSVPHPGLRAVALGAIGLLGIWYLFNTDGGWPVLTLGGLAAWLALRRTPGRLPWLR